MIQIRLNGILDCLQWTSTDTVSKNTIVTSTLVQVVEQACECGFTRDHITEDAFQCFPESQQHATFRARLNETSQVTTLQLITYIEQWVSTEGFISIQNVRLGINNTCSLVITDFNSPECPSLVLTTTSITSAANTGAVVGAVVGVLLALLVCGIAVTVIVIFVIVQRRMAHKKQTIDR